MKTKKTALGVVVIILAFCVGYITFEVVDIVGSRFAGVNAECRQKKEIRSCVEQNEGRFDQGIPGH